MIIDYLEEEKWKSLVKYGEVAAAARSEVLDKKLEILYRWWTRDLLQTAGVKDENLEQRKNSR